MQILTNYNNQPLGNHINFASHFVRTNILRSTFYFPYNYSDFQTTRQYANAIEGLLKDGKNDVIKFVDRKKYVNLKVNDKEYTRIDKVSTSANEMLTKLRKAIIDFADKERGIKKVYNYDNLSEQEIGYIKHLDVENKLKNLDPKNPKHAKKIEKIKEEVKKALLFGIQHKLYELDKEIGRPNKTQTMGLNLKENTLNFKNLLDS